MNTRLTGRGGKSQHQAVHQRPMGRLHFGTQPLEVAQHHMVLNSPPLVRHHCQQSALGRCPLPVHYPSSKAPQLHRPSLAAPFSTCRPTCHQSARRMSAERVLVRLLRQWVVAHGLLTCPSDHRRSCQLLHLAPLGHRLSCRWHSAITMPTMLQLRLPRWITGLLEKLASAAASPRPQTRPRS